MTIIPKESLDDLDLTDFQKEELGLLPSNHEVKLQEEIPDETWWTEFVLGG